MCTAEDLSHETSTANTALPDADTMQRIIDEHRKRGELPYWFHSITGVVFGVERDVPPVEQWEPVVVDGRFRGYRR